MGTRSIGWNHDLLRIEWVGTKERLVITDLSGRFERFPNDASSGVTVWHKPLGDYRHEFGATLGYSVQAFARALLAGQDPPITGIDAIREIEIDAAFTMSAERHAPVKIEHYG